MKQQPTPTDFAFLAALALLWGSSFLFTDLALADFAPVEVAAGRITIGALSLVLFARLTGEPVSLGKREVALLGAAGLTGAALPFALIAWAQQAVSSSMAAILISTTPLWTMLLAQVMTTDERITPARLAGALIGIGGVVVLMAGNTGEVPPPGRALGIVGGAVCYALTGLILRQVDYLPAPVSAAGSQVAAAALILPVAVATASSPLPPAPVWGWLVILGLFASGLATIIMVRLLYRAGATFVSFNNFLVPAVGVLLGVVILGEEAGLRQVAGLAFVLTGVGLSRRA